MRWTMLITLMLLEACTAMAGRIDVPIDSWTFTSRGNYVGRPDRRKLFQIIHPWTTSKAGDFGQIETKVTIPADARPPFTLCFYVSDNNYGQGHEQGTGVDWVNNDVRVGHRFKEALINGEVIWAEDTYLNDEPKHYLVDISRHVQAGETFTLAFRLRDEVDSNVTLPGDIYVTDYYAEKVATATKESKHDWYETRSYWGDVAIYTGAVPDADKIPWGWQTELKVPPPKPPVVDAAVDESAVLPIELPELLACRWRWPVTMGFPFAQGALKKASHIALLGSDGSPVPMMVRPLNRWPDGTLRWVSADFVLIPYDKGEYTLRWGTSVTTPPEEPADPVRAEGDYMAGNMMLSAGWPQADPGAGLVVTGANGNTAINRLKPYLEAGGKHYHARWLKGKWISRSAHRMELQVDGELVAVDGDRYGPCRLRVTVFADCPYVRLQFSITNERPEETFVTDAYGIKLEIADAKHVSAGTGWVLAESSGGYVTTVVRYFSGNWPIGIETSARGINLQLFKPGDERLPTYNTHPGESKTHEIWLALTVDRPADEDCDKLAALVETPPRLNISRRIRETFVWGELPSITADEHPDVYAKIEEKLSPYFENCKQGIRLLGEYPNWDNFYWNTLHTMYSLYAMTGERKWFDWAERSVRHHFDVDICHWLPEGGTEGCAVGAIHGYWGDQSDTPCYSLIQNCDGAFDHWNLTADPDGYKHGTGISDYVQASEHIGRGQSSREQGWPLGVMLRAWQETLRPKYLKHARRLVDIALGYLEPRRGTYIEVHGSVSHRGSTPFMDGILCTALRNYHRLTGDQRVAVAIVRIAEAVYAEMHDPLHTKTAPNIDYYYSPNPYLRGNDGFTPITTLNLNVAAAQAYGAYLTGDSGLADIARRSWLAGLEGGTVYPEMSYDLAGVVYWLDRMPDVRNR